MEFAISQPKVVRLTRNEKQTYRLNSRPQMWPMGLTLTITLTFEFCRSNRTLTFDHTHDLDHGSSWSNFEIPVSQNGKADWHFTKGVTIGHSWPWPFGDQGQVMDLPDSDRGDLICRHAVDSSSSIVLFKYSITFSGSVYICVVLHAKFILIHKIMALAQGQSYHSSCVRKEMLQILVKQISVCNIFQRRGSTR